MHAGAWTPLFVFKVAANLVDDGLGGFLDAAAGVHCLEIAELGVVRDQRGHCFLIGRNSLLDDVGAIVFALMASGAAMPPEPAGTRGLRSTGRSRPS